RRRPGGRGQRRAARRVHPGHRGRSELVHPERAHGRVYGCPGQRQGQHRGHGGRPE
ncbi:hypothetical protein PHISP_08803, partial [Aspergillus sp. HF37]